MSSLLSPKIILALFLMFVRVGSLIMTAPFFNTAAFPRRVKLFLALVLTFIVSFVVPSSKVIDPIQPNMPFIVTAVISELMVGVAIGLIGQLVFAGIEMAGRLISLKIALSFAQVANPMTQQRSDLVGTIFTYLAVIIFLAMNGDKVFINGLVKSFELIPITLAHLKEAGPYMLKVAKYLFVIAVQLAAPFLVVLFILDLSLAIFARLMPQANIMFIALPIKLFLGFTLLSWMLPYMPQAFTSIFNHLFEYLINLLGTIA